MGTQRWEEFTKLAAKLDIEDALWVVAASRYFDNPQAALSTIVRALYEVPEPLCEVMGRAFHDRCHEFFVKRLGLFGSRAEAELRSASVSDLFRCEDEHSANCGRVDEERETEPAPFGWNSASLWDHTIRLQEGGAKPLNASSREELPGA